MTVQIRNHVPATGRIDAPIFDPQAFRLNAEQSAIIATASELGQNVFACDPATPLIDANHRGRVLPGERTDLRQKRRQIGLFNLSPEP